MKVTVVCENRFRDYIVDIFEKHPESRLKLVNFADWCDEWGGGEKYVAVSDGLSEFRGIPVVKLGELKEYDGILVAGFNTGYMSQMMRALHDANKKNVTAVRWLSIHNRADFIDGDEYDKKHTIYFDSFNEGHPWLGEIQIHVTDNCNLNCKACTHFTPFVRKYRPMNFEKFEQDIKRLKTLFPEIFVLQLMGGEPLLEPKLCMEMIRSVRRLYPNCSINIITNGYLIDKMTEEFWTTVKENNVTFRVSVYPKILSKAEKIETILKSHGIFFLCEVYNKVEFDKYFSCRRESDGLKNMRRCHGRGCCTLYYGRMTNCPTPIYVRDVCEELNKAGIDGKWLYAEDAIDIYKENDSWSIIERLEKPFEFCSRCDISNTLKIPWEMTEGHLDPGDWFIDY